MSTSVTSHYYFTCRVSPGENLGQEAQRTGSEFGKSLLISGSLLAPTDLERLGASWRNKGLGIRQTWCECGPPLLFPAVRPWASLVMFVMVCSKSVFWVLSKFQEGLDLIYLAYLLNSFLSLGSGTKSVLNKREPL